MYYKSSEIQPNTNPKTLKFSLHWINFNLLLSPNSVITVVYIYIYTGLYLQLYWRRIQAEGPDTWKTEANLWCWV